MLKKFSLLLAYTSLALVVSESALVSSSYSQTAPQLNQNSTVGNNSNDNLVIQTPSQSNSQNSNVNEIRFPNIYPLVNPLQTPVNTENDFGLNLSLGVNTLDSSNVTVYLGFIYQPGRTDDHNNRMARLRKETDLLESQKQVTEAQLELLKKQIAEAEIRLQQMQRTETSPPNRVNSPK